MLGVIREMIETGDDRVVHLLICVIALILFGIVVAILAWKYQRARDTIDGYSSEVACYRRKLRELQESDPNYVASESHRDFSYSKNRRK